MWAKLIRKYPKEQIINQSRLETLETAKVAKSRIPRRSLYKRFSGTVLSKFSSKRARSRLTRYGLIVGNGVVLLAVVALVTLHFRAGEVATVSSQMPKLAAATGKTAAMATLSNPLDKSSSIDIALSVARAAGMPEQIAVNNTSDSKKANIVQSAVASSDSASKPQIVSTNFVSNKDIKTYVAKSGDTIGKIAAKYGVTSDSIRWSNGLTGDIISAGKKLYIPPVTGIAYVVKDGDTTASLAKHYNADKTKLIAYNDAELRGIKTGERIIIPNGQKPAPVAVSYASSYSNNYYGFAFGGSAVYGYNGYTPGFCTWFVANKIPVPANWGNANTWAVNARQTSGWAVSNRPSVGSIAQNSYMAYGLGHVAIVEDVSADGSKIKVSDMNYGGRWSERHGAWTKTSEFQNFIRH